MVSWASFHNASNFSASSSKNLTVAPSLSQFIYISALIKNFGYDLNISEYQWFTDIEFNPEKSINCQARTCALLVSLLKLNALDAAMKSQNDFINMISSDSFKKIHSSELRQGTLDL